MYLRLLSLIVAVLFLASASYADNGPKIGKTTQKINYNTQKNTNGVPLESPVFMDNFGPESFESTAFPPPGWFRFSPVNNIIQWSRITQGTLPPGWNPGFGLETTVPPGGGIAVAMITYDATGPLQNDCWFVTPKLYNVSTTDSLVFWLSKKAEYVDHLDVKISKTVNNVASAFTLTVAALSFPATNGDSAWVRKSYYLGNVSGLNNGDSIYIGFREWVTNNLSDGGIINIDLVQGIGSIVVSNDPLTGLVADKYGLAQNYPNPFNPSTTINYNIPKSGNVKLVVYDMLGNEVTTLVNEFKMAGTHQLNFKSGNLASGIYLYKLSVNGYSEVKKMTLIK